MKKIVAKGESTMNKTIIVITAVFSLSLAGCNEEKPTPKTQATATGDGTTKRMYIAPREMPTPPPPPQR